MKSVACLLLALAALSSATTYSYPRGCIYANGRCVQECPVGTQSYTIDCGYVTPEATCRNSRPKPSTKWTCGYSACHCVSPTVRDEASGQCVHLDKCPGAKIIKTHGGGGQPKIQRRPVGQKPFVAPHVPVHPTAPVAPVAPVKPVAPTPPVAPTAPVVPSVPVAYNYNSNPGYNNNAGYNTNAGYNGNSGSNSNSGYNRNSGYNANNAAPVVGYV